MKKGKEILYLTKDDVSQLNISMKDCIQILESAFTEKSKGKYEMPPKIAIHTQPGGDFLHAMPCWIDKLDAAGLKWVGGYHNNPKQSLPYISGLIVLNCTKTGVPLAIMDCIWVTAIRTGGVSGMSAKYLANPDSSVIGVIGCGVQGRSNLEAMHVVRPEIKKVFAFDALPDVAKRYAEDMSIQLGMDVVAVASPQEAVEYADILITAGPVYDISVIKPEWLKKGVTITSVDSDFQFKKAAIQVCDDFFTDDLGQFHTFRNSGMIRHIKSIPTEIGDVITGKKSGRKNPSDIVFACNIGLALGDIAIANEIYKQAVMKNVGNYLPL